ncbi:Na-K-Cl cotransporter [Fibrobacterota bacterium]
MNKENSIKAQVKFGTFGGVYVPTILTILGVIMYLRLGWVVGNAGLINTLLILLIAQSITILTALSLSEICTNMELKGGGAYYLISRSLGIELGGSIGLPLFLSQTLGIGFYVVGFSETFCWIFPQFDVRLVGSVALVVLTCLALISSSLVVKTQYLVLGIIALSLASLLMGIVPSAENVILSFEYSQGLSFWAVFAVFFPAVTGMEAGLSMSGDLRNPKKAIPWGTMAAVLTGFVIYGALIFWFSMAAPREALIGNKGIVLELATWKPIILAGIWAATLSSALASILAAPRTLQAMAEDKIFSRIFAGKGRGTPRITTLIAFAMALLVIQLGELNLIAPLLTMFFLITYGSINLIAGLQKILKLPSYRPSFRVHWSLSILGAAGSVWVMFVLNFWACLAGFACVLAIFIILKRRQFQSNWGDARRGLWQSLVQYGLIKLEETIEHPKNWRPNILVFSKFHLTRQHLMGVAAALANRRGLITMIQFVDTNNREALENLKKERKAISDFLQGQHIAAFSDVAVAEDAMEAQLIAAQVHGIGNYRPNTLLMEWAETRKSWFSGESAMSRQMKLLKFYREMGKSILLLDVNQQRGFGRFKCIHVWWDPTQENGSFMLLLAFLISSSEHWQGCSLYLKSVVASTRMTRTEILLRNLVENARIPAHIQVYSPPEEGGEAGKTRGFLIQNYRKPLRLGGRMLNLFTGKKRKGRRPTEMLLDSDQSGEGPAPQQEVPGTEGQPPDSLSSGAKAESLMARQVDAVDETAITGHIDQIIIENSAEADLVILGFNLPSEGKEHAYVSRMDHLTEQLPTTLLVHAGFDIDLFS